MCMQNIQVLILNASFTLLVYEQVLNFVCITFSAIPLDRDRMIMYDWESGKQVRVCNLFIHFLHVVHFEDLLSM